MDSPERLDPAPLATDPLEIAPPPTGRIHQHRRRVALGDSDRHGRVRLDALARMLQDVSDEDTTDAGFPADEPWVVRRVDLGVTEFPAFRDTVTVTTWCSGIGARWAERRVRIVGDRSGVVDAAVLWVHLDASGRPARLTDAFTAPYAEAARGRTVRARLQHRSRPDAGTAATDGSGRSGFAFPLRATDIDVVGHVNNAVSWVPVEQVLAQRATRGDGLGPVRVTLEHPAPIEPDAAPEVTVMDRPSGGFDLWITVDDTVASSVELRPWDHPHPMTGDAARR